MNHEAFALALTTVVRPTSAAAVVAMLATSHPRRLLVAYIVAGLTFSLGVGTVVVVLVQGFGPSAGTSGRPMFDIVLGATALAYVAAGTFGWLPPRGVGRTPGSGWMRRRLQHLSLPVAAAAGVVTHLPGLVYLAALNAIVDDTAHVADGVVQVVLYNAIWFSLPIVALVLSKYRPVESRQRLEDVGAWTRRHQRVLTLMLLGGLGTYLVVIGVLGLFRPAS